MSRPNSGPTRRTRKVVIGLASLAMAVGAIAVSTGQANASEPVKPDSGDSRVLICPARGCL